MAHTIIENLDFLSRLVRANRLTFQATILNASDVQFRSIIDCLDIFNSVQSLRSWKVLRNAKRITRSRAVFLFRKNYKVLKSLILFAIVRILKAAVESVLNSEF